MLLSEYPKNRGEMSRKKAVKNAALQLKARSKMRER